MSEQNYNQYVMNAIEEGEDLDDILSFEDWVEHEEHERFVENIRQMVRNYPGLKANPTREDFIQMQKIK